MTRVVVVVLVLLLLGVWTSWTAGRLDRLHARVDAAWAALDAALVRRAAAARALARQLPDGPEARAVDAAAAAALRGGPVGREGVENDLTATLRAALPLLPAAGSEAVREELATATTRVGLARSFHNSAVSDSRALRRKRLPRALRLAGHRAVPQHFDIDDDVLRGLPAPARAQVRAAVRPAPSRSGARRLG